jgi:hypothetical protein
MFILDLSFSTPSIWPTRSVQGPVENPVRVLASFVLESQVLDTVSTASRTRCLHALISPPFPKSRFSLNSSFANHGSVSLAHLADLPQPPCISLPSFPQLLTPSKSKREVCFVTFEKYEEPMSSSVDFTAISLPPDPPASNQDVAVAADPSSSSGTSPWSTSHTNESSVSPVSGPLASTSPQLVPRRPSVAGRQYAERQTNDSTPTSRASVAVACVACRNRHLKCDGESPCSRCLQDGSQCSYVRSRRGWKPPKNKNGSPMSPGTTSNGMLFHW